LDHKSNEFLVEKWYEVVKEMKAYIIDIIPIAVHFGGRSTF
jgi:gluconate 2-dehydrogenase alpha chain